MPQVLCMDDVKVDVQAKRKQQEELRNYLDSQVASRLSLNASREESIKPFLDFQAATLRACEASEQIRLKKVADQKRAYKADLDRQAADDSRRKAMAKERQRMGTTLPTSVNALTGRPLQYELIPTPQMSTLGVKMGYAVVPKVKHKHTRDY